MSAAAQLLERYGEAKDLARSHLAPEIFASNVTLTYSIATDAIAFAARTEGIECVTRALISDFALRFSRCRTYYVCDAPIEDAHGAAFVPWLVVMRETAAACLRIGKGYYRWDLTPADQGIARASALHIHIERMDPIPDADGRLLEAVQSVLPYPWLLPGTLRRAFEQFMQQSSAFSFLRDFTAPVAAPVEP